MIELLHASDGIIVDVCQCGGVHWHTYPYIGKLILQANYQASSRYSIKKKHSQTFD